MKCNRALTSENAWLMICSTEKKLKHWFQSYRETSNKWRKKWKKRRESSRRHQQLVVSVNKNLKEKWSKFSTKTDSQRHGLSTGLMSYGRWNSQKDRFKGIFKKWRDREPRYRPHCSRRWRKWIYSMILQWQKSWHRMVTHIRWESRALIKW